MTNSIKYAEAQMLIRKPAKEVFDAFIDPEITKNFWFTKGSGKLEVNKKVTWEWEMYGIAATVVAKEIIPREKIIFEWHDPPRTVTFSFRSLTDGSTYVVITETGQHKAGDLLDAVRDSTGGFTTVLDGLKAFLEHGIRLNLIGDKFPKEVLQHKK